MGRRIEIVWKYVDDIHFVTETFTDWYDFADFVKQRELAGSLVIIKSWRYVGGFNGTD